MCNFNKQNDDIKIFIHLLLEKYSLSVGGANFLLGLKEALKEKKPNALINSACKIDSKELTIRWNKIIFKDKFDILEEVLISHKNSENQDFNLLENNSLKKQKKILNMVKTLAPIEFIVTSKVSQDDAGFNFKIFETVEEGCVKVNPLFAIIFFCPTEYMKKALKYEIRE